MGATAHTYASTDPDCPPGRKWLCVGWLSKGCAVFHYGATEAEARDNLRAWLEAEREKKLKLQIRESRQQRAAARQRATAAREAADALWGDSPQEEAA